MVSSIYVKDIEFSCSDNLSQYTNSLLFDSGEDIATLKVYDLAGNHIDLWLTVQGEKSISLPEDNNRQNEVYKEAGDYPPELIKAIKEGEIYEDYYCDLNNWFEYLYDICGKDNAEKSIYSDGEVCEEDISELTSEQLKAEMLDYAEYLLEDAYDRGTIERPELSVAEIAEIISDKVQQLDGGEMLCIKDFFPNKDIVLNIERNTTPATYKPDINVTVYVEYNAAKAELMKLHGKNPTIMISKSIDFADIGKAIKSIANGSFKDIAEGKIDKTLLDLNKKDKNVPEKQ